MGRFDILKPSSYICPRVRVYDLFKLHKLIKISEWSFVSKSGLSRSDLSDLALFFEQVNSGRLRNASSSNLVYSEVCNTPWPGLHFFLSRYLSPLLVKKDLLGESFDPPKRWYVSLLVKHPEPNGSLYPFQCFNYFRRIGYINVGDHIAYFFICFQILPHDVNIIIR